MVNKRVQNAVLGCNLKNDRMISVHFQGKPFKEIEENNRMGKTGDHFKKIRVQFSSVQSLSHVQLLVIPWIAAYQAPPSMGFARQEYWSGVPLPSPVGLHRTIQLELLQHYWLGHGLALLWYCMVCLGNKWRLFCRFWDCIQVLHFRLFCWLWWLLLFF